MDVGELINAGLRDYERAIELLDRGDYYDAAEKAWNAIESFRKAFLVALGVPYQKARTVSYGLPLFGRLMRALGLKKLLRRYEWFDYKLHIMGFYERLTLEDEIEFIIRRYVEPWLNRMKNVILKLRGVNISDVLEIYDKSIRLRQEVLRKSSELMEINNELAKIIHAFALRIRSRLTE